MLPATFSLLLQNYLRYLLTSRGPGRQTELRSKIDEGAGRKAHIGDANSIL
jgi:hypothetical protein